MKHTPPETDPQSKIDRIGVIASSLCAVHCLLCALAPAAFAALGLGVLLGHEAEWAFVAVTILIASGALALGWRRHRSRRVVALMLLGFVALLGSRGLEMSSGHHDDGHHAAAEHKDSAKHDAHKDDAHKDDTHKDGHDDEHEDATHLAGAGLGVLGGLLIVAGHAVNLRAQRRRRTPPGECCETC